MSNLTCHLQKTTIMKEMDCLISLSVNKMDLAFLLWQLALCTHYKWTPRYLCSGASDLAGDVTYWSWEAGLRVPGWCFWYGNVYRNHMETWDSVHVTQEVWVGPRFSFAQVPWWAPAAGPLGPQSLSCPPKLESLLNWALKEVCTACYSTWAAVLPL